MTERNQFVMVRSTAIERDEAKRMRSDLVKCLLNTMVEKLRRELDAAEFLNIGGMELMEFMEAIASGGNHPLLTEWEQNRTKR